MKSDNSKIKKQSISYDKHYWSTEEFIKLLLSKSDNKTPDQSIENHITKELNEQGSSNDFYQPPEEGDSCLAEEIERIVGTLRNIISNISQEMSLPIIFWMRTALQLHSEYGIDIEPIIKAYTYWRENDGKNLNLVYFSKRMKNTSKNIPFDVFLIEYKYSQQPKKINTSEWRIEETPKEITPKKKAKNTKDEYHGIGKKAYENLKQIIEEAAKDFSIINLLPIKGSNKLDYIFYGTRKELYEILVSKFSLKLTFNSYSRATPHIINLTKDTCNFSLLKIKMIKNMHKANNP